MIIWEEHTATYNRFMMRFPVADALPTTPVSFREKIMTLPKRTPTPMQRPKPQAIGNL
jgi:hypothetical protein